MATPPVDRVRPYKAETSATGGTASDDRAYPRVLDPQRDGLDAAGLFMQQVGSADREVCVWREGNLMRFRDLSMPPGASVTLSQLAEGGGGGTSDPPPPSTPWVSLMDIQPRQGCPMEKVFALYAEKGPVELRDDDYPDENPYRVFASVAGLTHVRFSVVVLEWTGEFARIWIEGSLDDGYSWQPLAVDTGTQPRVDVTTYGGLGPEQNLWRSEVLPFDLAGENYGTPPALWLRVMIEPLPYYSRLRLGAIRVEGMAEEGPI